MPPTITAWRDHDFSYGHRVFGHESKCAFLHGHNARVRFHCAAPALDAVGRVIDFGIIKLRLCNWLENAWDHRMLVWEGDPIGEQLKALDSSILRVPFNPTAENMAAFLVETVGPVVLRDSDVVLTRVDFFETRKCGVTVTL